MKFDADKVLTDRSGVPVLEGEKVLTHGVVLVRALDAQLPDDKELKADEVRRRYVLGARLMAGGLVDLTHEQADLLQKRVCVFQLAIAGQLIEALDTDATASNVVPMSA